MNHLPELRNGRILCENRTLPQSCPIRPSTKWVERYDNSYTYTVWDKGWGVPYKVPFPKDTENEVAALLLKN